MIKEIFSVRVKHKPLLYKNNEKKFISEVENIDPCDMLPPIKKLSLDTEFRSMDEEKEDEENKFELFCKKCANLFEIGGIKISPVDIMRVFGDWLNLNNELIDFTCSELKSSYEYQEFIYRHPKPMPTLNSTSIEWEQSLIESHPTHPILKVKSFGHESKTGKLGPHFFVHYKGWKKTWDEWVPEERLLKLNEESLQKQKQLKELHSTKNKKRQPKIPKVDGEIKSLKIILNKQDQNQTKKRGADAMDLDLDDSTQEGATKVLGKQKADQAEENIERVEVKRIRIKLGGSNNNKVDVKGKQVEKIHDKVEENQETQEKNESVNVEFKIPQFLLDKLVEDWEFITKYKRNLLLYKEENIQNSEIHKTHPNKEWSDLYGAEHLLRLFVKFPELLSQAQMNQKEKENFETNIIDFLNFLETNESKYFEKLSGQNSKSIAAKKQKTNIKRTRTTKVHDNPYG
ncbi:14620_t:CDS:10 [Entrophospora sp. SA101]|nr:14620_t:CDS:10 [Entrophospora sp. SA101]